MATRALCGVAMDRQEVSSYSNNPLFCPAYRMPRSSYANDQICVLPPIFLLTEPFDLVKKRVPPELDFHERLVSLRKERGPDDDLKLQFEAASRLNADEKNVIRSVIESIVLRNTFKTAERRFTVTESGGTRP